MLQRMYCFSNHLQERKRGRKDIKVGRKNKHKNYKEFGMYSNFYIKDFGEVFTKNNAFQIKINNAIAPEIFHKMTSFLIL